MQTHTSSYLRSATVTYGKHYKRHATICCRLVKICWGKKRKTDSLLYALDACDGRKQCLKDFAWGSCFSFPQLRLAIVTVTAAVLFQATTTAAQNCTPEGGVVGNPSSLMWAEAWVTGVDRLGKLYNTWRRAKSSGSCCWKRSLFRAIMFSPSYANLAKKGEVGCRYTEQSSELKHWKQLVFSIRFAATAFVLLMEENIKTACVYEVWVHGEGVQFV